MDTTDTKRIGQRPPLRVAVSSHDKGMVLLHLERGVLFDINLVGCAVLDLLRRNLQPDAIVRHVADTYGIDNETATHDVDAFMRQLADHDLLTVNETL
jgi:hypothetical protein